MSSSGQDSFTIPRRIPRKKKDGAQPPDGGHDPPSPVARAASRKVLPTRTARTSDAALEPEWEDMSRLLSHFYARSDAAPFREAVNWKALGLFDYPRIIKKPMDLGNVKRKINEGRYESVFEAAEDMRLIWKNCMTYNREGTDFHRLGQKLSKKFEEKYHKLCTKHNGGIPSPSKTKRKKSKADDGEGKPPARRKSKADDDDDDERKPRARRRSRPETPTPRASGRNAKRKLDAYTDELEDTDTDDLMTSGEEEELEKRRKKRLARKKRKNGEAPQEDEARVDDSAEMGDDAEDNPVKYEIEGPPPGQMNCLWYSREPFRHVFVLEKILGWKTRPVMKLESCEPVKTEGDVSNTPASSSAKDKRYSLPPDEATKIKEKAIVDTRNDFRKRRDISRINPGNCPYIQKIAAAEELARSKKEGRDPAFKLVKPKQQREEVFLIKWRGRSHLHCSWERACDLHKYDQSSQQGAARGKISRFDQSQVASLGHDWKRVLEDERRAQAKPGAHSHHSHTPVKTPANGTERPTKVDDDEEEEPPDADDYFSPLYYEVDRIIGCDENELDMAVLHRQRALNIRAEQEALEKREKEDEEEGRLLEEGLGLKSGDGDTEEANGKDGEQQAADDDAPEEEKEEEWDPEDNVRYIVRWKGLQLTEATWEYWIDIKMDFVNEVEDFWLRQKAPSPEEVEEIEKQSHPHPRSFKKMHESPVFGVSEKERPVAKLGDADENDNSNDGDSESNSDENESVLKLRSYQLEGVNWLLWNWYNRRSCILADEMGLGKTIQSIGFLTQLQKLPQANLRGPFLIVAPLSLVSQWESEAKEWAPDVNVVVYHGSADARDFLVKNEFYYTDQFETRATAQNLKRKHITKFQVLITTYEVVLKDANVLSKIHWKVLIVDEAHRLKNVKSRLFDDLAAVPRDFCLLLTGTPLQNSTEELWALLHFADPTSFGSREEFTMQFGQLQDAHQVADLHTVLRPFLLRRVKEDVEKALPPKEETILEITLTPIQKQFYKAIYEKNTGFLFKGIKPSNAPSLMNVMMELRKCCNHPFLIKGAEDRIIDDAAETELKSLTSTEQMYRQIDYAKLTGEQLIKSSGKFVLLSKLLPKLQAGGHKVLIFSQMVRVLDLLQELLQLNHYRYERLDGNTSASARNSAVDRFKRDSFKRFVMLLSTRAGGLGLNLTAADTVIIFDSDWNPQNDLQAMARAHRIGQTRSVRVYRLLTAKTYEMHMFHSASLKLGLDRAVLAHQRQNTNANEVSSKRKSRAEKEEQAKEIDLLLKKGAYDVFNDDDDNEGQKFMDTDIDQLLEKSSRTVTYGAAATNSLSSGLGSFSKASFVASTEEGSGKDVDLDDPDFWSKAVGLEAPPEEEDPTMALIIGDGSKRSRRQVQTFDPFKEEAEAEQMRLEELKLQKQAEKEEKERLKLEKFLAREAEREAKEKAKMEKEKAKQEERALKEALRRKKLLKAKEAKDLRAKEVQKRAKQVKVVFNSRKTDRKRLLKRAENEDPVFERVKQAWDMPQRNRMVNAILKIGFGRFTKIRHYSNFTSLPIQDVEVFTRSYVYQLGLQAASTVLSSISGGQALSEDMDAVVRTTLSKVLVPLIGKGKDFDWVCNAVLTSLCMHMRMKSHDAYVRMPLALAEPTFLYDLRQGVAIRSLQRLSFLSRLNSIIEEVLDKAINDIGREAMGQRGCLTNDYTTLDMDQKGRYVTTEELTYGLSVKLSLSSEPCRFVCPPWWDRSCDLGLIVGTFFHGLGNYNAMRSDKDLPFANKIKCFINYNKSEAESYRHFDAAAAAAKEVFDTALVTMKRKFQEQTHAAVAAVFAANKGNKPEDSKAAYKPKLQEMNDEDIVSLGRLKEATVKAFRLPFETTSKSGKKLTLKYSLPMPDSKHLDQLLVSIVEDLERNPSERHTPQNTIAGEKDEPEKAKGSKVTAISINREIWQASKRTALIKPQLLFSGSLSGVDKKPQDDSSDYFLGAASQDLASIAVGADSSRYQRGQYVPMIVTRFALGGILLAEESTIDCLVEKDPVKKSLDIDSNAVNGDKKGEESAAAVSSERSVDLELQPPQMSSKIPAPSWQFVKNDTALRATICTILLNGGYPSPGDLNVSAELLLELNRNPALLSPIHPSSLSPQAPTTNCPLFSMEAAFSPVLKNAAINWPDKKESLEEYFQSVLLPHCLKLCLMLAREQKKVASDQGNPDVYLGRPSYENLSPLPDPFIPFADHSEEALSNAFAILRRTRLMKSIRFIVSGGIPLSVLTEFLRGKVWRQQAGGIPVWWCPWIHDLGLLVHAALYGLSSITKVLPLQQSLIQEHVRATFVDGTIGQKPALPKSFLDQASKAEVDAWVEMHSKQFPTFDVIENRLAQICSRLTVGTNVQYDNVPMFDTGGWPMVTDPNAPGNLADTRTSGSRCLMSDYETLSRAVGSQADA